MSTNKAKASKKYYAYCYGTVTEQNVTNAVEDGLYKTEREMISSILSDQEDDPAQIFEVTITPVRKVRAAYKIEEV